MMHPKKHLDRLSDLLEGLPIAAEPMSVGVLDGFVAGLIVCPDSVMPSEWLPEVLSEDRHVPMMEAERFDAVTTAIIAHYNRVAKVLVERPASYAPIFELDPNSEQVLWEPWIEGFERAMRLRPDAWLAIAESDDEEAAAAINLILAMNDMYENTPSFDEATLDRFDDVGPALIVPMTQALNAWTKRHGGVPPPMTSAPIRHSYDAVDPTAIKPRVGRNAQCPCGSGRKYKRCCGAN